MRFFRRLFGTDLLYPYNNSNDDGRPKIMIENPCEYGVKVKIVGKKKELLSIEAKEFGFAILKPGYYHLRYLYNNSKQVSYIPHRMNIGFVPFLTPKNGLF